MENSNIDHKRTGNFSEREIRLLVDTVRNYKDVVECKRSDAVTWREKERAWEKICQDFNTVSGGIARTAKQLRTKFENVKKVTKKKYAAERQEIFKTGGGTCNNIEITDTDKTMKEILTVGITGIESKYDSDSSLFHSNTITSGNNTDNNTTPIMEHSYSNKERSAVIILDDSQVSYVENCQAIGDDIQHETIKNTGDTQWSGWTPSTLQTPKSASIKVSGTSLSRKEQVKKRKTDLTADCRLKINVLSEAKLELIKLQQECLKQDINLKKEEHDLKMLQMAELHKLKVQQTKLEIARLKSLVTDD